MATGGAAQCENKLDAIPNVDIDTGRFKYVLIRVDQPDEKCKQERSKTIVRGYSWAAFHGKQMTTLAILILRNRLAVVTPRLVRRIRCGTHGFLLFWRFLVVAARWCRFGMQFGADLLSPASRRVLNFFRWRFLFLLL